ncbi:MAG: hypothetical protein MSK63_01330 [Clostridiales bacterium]|nr:hypothetical protein [Clostridiales bacterium]
MREQSRKVALCGVLCGLAVVVLLLGGLFSLAVYCAPLLAMAVLLPVLEEYGPGTAGAAYGAVAILAPLLVPDRETALVYVFFGWYPILRPRIAALPSLPVRLVCRLGVCGLSMFLLYGVTIRLLGLTAVTEELGGGWLTAALAVMGCAVFLLLDLALGRLTVLWRRKLRRRFFRK